MLWFHRLQQRLSLTRNEALALIVLSALFIAGLAVRHVQQHTSPIAPDAYDEADRLFFERSAKIGREAAVDTLDHTSPTPPAASGTAVQHTAETNADAVPFEEHRIDLNRASEADLQRLPRIGPKTAQRIVEFREAYGHFRHVDDLLQVRGIGPKTLELLRPMVTVTAPPR